MVAGIGLVAKVRLTSLWLTLPSLIVIISWSKYGHWSPAIMSEFQAIRGDAYIRKAETSSTPSKLSLCLIGWKCATWPPLTARESRKINIFSWHITAQKKIRFLLVRRRVKYIRQGTSSVCHSVPVLILIIFLLSCLKPCFFAPMPFRYSTLFTAPYDKPTACPLHPSLDQSRWCQVNNLIPTAPWVATFIFSNFLSTPAITSIDIPWTRSPPSILPFQNY